MLNVGDILVIFLRQFYFCFDIIVVYIFLEYVYGGYQFVLKCEGYDFSIWFFDFLQCFVMNMGYDEYRFWGSV